MKKSRVIFKINAEKELYYIKKAKKEGVRLSKEAEKLLKLDNADAIKTLNKQYKDENIIEFKDELKKLWRKIANSYFTKTKRLIGYEWKQKEYACYITLNVPGFADVWSKKAVVMGKRFSIPLFGKIYVLAHELFHVYYFEIIDMEKLPSSAKETVINESVPILALVLEKELNKFWPYMNLENSTISYKEVAKNINKLIPLWSERRNFKDFMLKALKKLRLR